MSCDWTNSADLPQFTFNQYHRHLLSHNRRLRIFAHAHVIPWNLSYQLWNPYACLSRLPHSRISIVNNVCSQFFLKFIYTLWKERRNSSHKWYKMNWVSSERTTCFFQWVRGVKIKKYIIEIHLGRFCMVMFTCARINVRTRKKASLFYLIKCTICPKASSSSSSLIMIILDSLIEIVFIARTLSYSSAQNFSLYARLLIMRRFFLLAHKGIRVKSEWRLCKKKILLGWRTSWEKFFKRPVNRKINHRISRLSLSLE